MRLRGLLTAILAVIVMVVWTGCDDASQVEQLQGPDPSFAKGGPDAACSTKGLPVRDYFLDRTDKRFVGEQLRLLTAACEDLDGATALEIAFSIWGKTQDARMNGDDGAADKGAAVVHRVMEIVSGYYDCLADGEGQCAALTVDDNSRLPTVGELTMALSDGGSFGVVGLVSDAMPVYSFGLTDVTDRWGIEPDGLLNWPAVLPLAYESVNAALIWGFPGDGLGGLGAETPLDYFGYDWNVAPWFVDTSDIDPLAVGSCHETVETNNQNRISHGARILLIGDPPSYCDPGLYPLAQSGWGGAVTRLAARVIPLWPQALHASLMVGKSGSGKAREFSPFHAYDVPPEGALHFWTQPSDAVTWVGPGDPPDAAVICERVDGACVAGIRITWSTQAGSPLESEETLQITAIENNGSKVELWGDGESGRERDPTITCNGDTGCEFTNLTLNKPGGYSLCVQSAGGGTSGLTYPSTCSEAFHIKYP